MKTKDISQAVVGFIVMISFMVVLWAVFKIEMPAANRDLALILLGVLASKFGDVVGYFYNSSKGSSEKTDIISKLPPVAILLIPLFILASCAPVKQQVVEVPLKYKEKIVERQVPVIVPADSSALFALFQCDSLNQVIMKDLNEQKGRASSNLDFNAGKLTYKLIFKHDTIYKTVTDTIRTQDKAIKVEVVKEVNRLTKWQIGQMHIGRFFMTMLMAYGIYRLLKWKLKNF